MTADFRYLVLAMAKERPNARVSTIVDLALAITEGTLPDLADSKALGHWAARQRPVAEALSKGQPIQAIKELRVLTGATLRQAKDAIDEVRS